MRTRALLLALAAGACTPTRVEVRTEAIDLAGARGVMRESTGLCEAEPRFLLDDVSSVNGVLKTFLRRYPQAQPAAWDDAELALLDDARERLPRVLSSHQAVLEALAACEFARTGAWPELRARAAALITETGAKLEAAGEALQEARKARALAAWHRELAANSEAGARACSPRTRATIFIAWREGGRTTWRFCDGTRAVAERGAAPQLEWALDGKHLAQRAYFESLSRFPADALQSAPGEELSAW